MKNGYWLLILAILLVVCCVSGVLLMSPGADASQAQIVSQSRVVRIVDLKIDQEFQITTNDGGVNTITVRDGKIAVTEANCPDHYCMHRGFVSSGAQIVCLPNRLVISFLNEQEIDGVAG